MWRYVRDLGRDGLRMDTNGGNAVDSLSFDASIESESNVLIFLPDFLTVARPSTLNFLTDLVSSSLSLQYLRLSSARRPSFDASPSPPSLFPLSVLDLRRNTLSTAGLQRATSSS